MNMTADKALVIAKTIITIKMNLSVSNETLPQILLITKKQRSVTSLK